MASKNTFVSNGKTFTLGDGKLDLSPATADFKNRVQMFGDGINKMNDKRNYYGDCLAIAKLALALYEKGAVVEGAVKAEKQAEIDRYQKAWEDISAEIKRAMPEFDKTDKNLYYAYRQYVRGEVEYEVYQQAFAEWLDAAGIAPTTKGIEYFTTKIGVNKASAKAMYRNGGKTFVGEKGEKTFLDLVYRIMATLMYSKNVLREYTYEYKLPEKKKAAPATTTEQATPTPAAEQAQA